MTPNVRKFLVRNENINAKFAEILADKERYGSYASLYVKPCDGVEGWSWIVAERQKDKHDDG